MPDPISKKPFPLIAVLGPACIVLALLVIVLSTKVRTLSAANIRLEAQALAGPSEVLSAGQAVQPMVLLDPQGNSTPLSFEPGNGSVLMLISSGSCDYCEIAKPIWNQIANDHQSDPLRIVGLALDTTPDQIQEADYPYEMYTPGGDAMWLMSRISGVPTALLIDENGIVVTAFYGQQEGLGDAVSAHLLEKTNQLGMISPASP